MDAQGAKNGQKKVKMAKKRCDGQKLASITSFLSEIIIWLFAYDYQLNWKKNDTQILTMAAQGAKNGLK